MPFTIATRGGGGGTASSDVSINQPPIPPAPIPAPNQVQMSQASPGTCSTKVKILNQAIVTTQSVTTQSNGSPPTAKAGVMSKVVNGPAKFLQGSAAVTVEGQPPGFQSAMLGQNGTSFNTIGVHDKPSQTKVTIAR